MNKTAKRERIEIKIELNKIAESKPPTSFLHSASFGSIRRIEVNEYYNSN